MGTPGFVKYTTSWKEPAGHLVGWNPCGNSYGCWVPAGAGRWLAHVPPPASSQAKLASACFRVRARPLTAAPRALWGLPTTPRLSGQSAEPPAFPPPLSHGDFGLIPSAQDTTEPLPLCLTTWASRHRPREPSGMRLACFLRCIHFIKSNPACVLPFPSPRPGEEEVPRECPLLEGMASGVYPPQVRPGCEGPCEFGRRVEEASGSQEPPSCAPGPLPSPGSVSWKERQCLLGKGV